MGAAGTTSQRGRQHGQRQGHQRQAGLIAVKIIQVLSHNVQQDDEKIQDARAQQNGRAYATTAEEAVQDTVVIIGTLLIYTALITLLFDIGSTHTFITKTFIERIGTSVEGLGYDLVVPTFAGAILTTRVCVRGVVVLIQQSILLADFTVLPMREFDTIFGMDWMTQHALIDCQKKKVQLRLKQNVWIAFQGTSRDKGGCLISFQ